MSSRIAFYLQLSVWTVCLSITVLIGYWTLVLPSLTVMVLVLLLFIGLAWAHTLSRQGLVVLATPLNTGFSLFWFALLLAAVFSIDPSRSWTKVWMWSLTLLVYFISVTAFRSGWKPERFIQATIVMASVAMLSGYIQLYVWLEHWYSLTGWPGALPPRMLRVWGVTTSPNEMAMLVTIAMILAIAYTVRLAQSPSRKLRTPMCLWFLAVIPMLILPGSRSGWFSASLGISTILIGSVWLSHRQTDFFSFRILGRTLAFSAIPFAAVALLIIVRRPETLQINPASVSFRLPFWQIALDTWQQYSWLGSGPGTYGTAYMLVRPVPYETGYMHAHNLFLNVLAELGTVGFLALVLLCLQIGLFFWRVRHSPNWDMSTIGFLAVLASFTGHSLFEMPETWISMLVAICLAALVVQLEPYSPVTKSLELRNCWVCRWTIGLWLCLLLTGVLGWQANRAYTAGVEALRDHKLSAAAAHFERGQRWLPYHDTGLALAQGITYSLLALDNDSYLPKAEAALVHVATAEPGWPLNHANLAAIHWHQGQQIAAIESMEKAISLSPELPTLHLNLGIWYEASGDSAQALKAYRDLYQLPYTPREITFWQETTIRQTASSGAPSATEVTGHNTPGVQALDENNPTLAQELFLAETAAYPNRTTAQLGLAIAYLQTGEPELAGQALRQAQALDAGQVTVRLYGSQQLYIHLWQAVLAGKNVDPLLEAIYKQSMLNYGNYSLNLFNRMDLPYSLLPQLLCFDRSPTMAKHLRWLSFFYERQSELPLANEPVGILMHQLKTGNGLRSCLDVQFAEATHRSIR
jgi:O-antigen ligase/tetratricopeptide (TPR) repeat protein